MNACKTEDDCTQPMWCRGKSECAKVTSARGPSESAAPLGTLSTGDLFGLMATANKLLQIQELMRRIHGDSYAARIAPWQRIIEAKAKHDGTSETAAAVALAKDSPNGPQALLILAAAVEMKSPNVADEPTRRTENRP